MKDKLRKARGLVVGVPSSHEAWANSEPGLTSAGVTFLSMQLCLLKSLVTHACASVESSQRQQRNNYRLDSS